MCQQLLNKLFGKFQALFIMTIIGGILSLLDVYTDVAVMIEWYRNGDYWWASGILFFLLLSHCWSSYIMYGRVSNTYGQSAAPSALNNIHKCIPMHLFLAFIGFAPFQLLYIFHNLRRFINQQSPQREKDLYYGMRVRIGRFKFIESIFESIPNGGLQIYFIYFMSFGDILSIDPNQLTTIILIVSVLLSINSVGRGIAKWIKINVIRNALKTKREELFHKVKLIQKWYIEVLSTIYFASDYVLRVLSMMFIFTVCVENGKKWIFAVIMVIIVCWEAVCCKIVVYFWIKSTLRFPGGLAQNLSSSIFHIIASVFTAYYYNGVRPSTVGSIMVLLSRYIINIILFAVYVPYSKHTIVENWNLIYLCIMVLNILCVSIWLYFKYKVIRLLYLTEIGRLEVCGQTAAATQEATMKPNDEVKRSIKLNEVAVQKSDNEPLEHVEKKQVP